ncbi:MAG: alanyl-tRNA editing protein [Candidatus Poseidoniaceae archaeon]|tara:strand:- start:1458 stop:2222 length:765 start_codon:yes stop_codon:yes gene_type:complete
MATTKLYLENIEAAYQTKFSAKVIKAEEESIVLDRTLFYPLGGGQNWDEGTISGPNGPIEVREVRGREDIIHNLGVEHQLEVGDEVIGEIDWERRYSHMRMHTAQHLVSGIAYELFNGVRTVGNQINTTHSRIDFNPISFDESMLAELTKKTNEIISLKHEVTDLTMMRDEINTIMPPERTNMDLIPSFIDELRVVKIGDSLDLCPCAGTHISNISEIGEISIIGKKSKGKGTQRITYELSNGEFLREKKSKII